MGTTSRGYGYAHQRERARWSPLVEAGEVNCWRCGTPLNPDDWHLGHDDHDRTVYRGPECPPCNLSAGGRKARQNQRRTGSQDW